MPFDLEAAANKFGNAANTVNSQMHGNTPSPGQPADVSKDPSVLGPAGPGQGTVGQLINKIQTAAQNYNMRKNDGNSAASDTGSNQAANNFPIPDVPPGPAATPPPAVNAPLPALDTTSLNTPGAGPTPQPVASGGPISDSEALRLGSKQYRREAGVQGLALGGPPLPAAGGAPPARNPNPLGAPAGGPPGNTLRPATGPPPAATPSQLANVGARMNAMQQQAGQQQGNTVSSGASNTTSDPGAAYRGAQANTGNVGGAGAQQGWGGASTGNSTGASQQPSTVARLMPQGPQQQTQMRPIAGPAQTGVSNIAPRPASTPAVQPAMQPQAKPNPLAVAAAMNRQWASGGPIEGHDGGGMIKGLGASGMHDLAKLKPVSSIKIKTIRPLKVSNSIMKSFADGGAVGGSMDSPVQQPVQQPVEHLDAGARHIRAIHPLMPPSARPHLERAHKAIQDDIHTAAFAGGGPLAGADPGGGMGPIPPPPPPDAGGGGGLPPDLAAALGAGPGAGAGPAPDPGMLPPAPPPAMPPIRKKPALRKPIAAKKAAAPPAAKKKAPPVAAKKAAPKMPKEAFASGGMVARGMGAATRGGGYSC